MQQLVLIYGFIPDLILQQKQCKNCRGYPTSILNCKTDMFRVSFSIIAYKQETTRNGQNLHFAQQLVQKTMVYAKDLS